MKSYSITNHFFSEMTTRYYVNDKIVLKNCLLRRKLPIQQYHGSYLYSYNKYTLKYDFNLGHRIFSINRLYRFWENCCTKLSNLIFNRFWKQEVLKSPKYFWSSEASGSRFKLMLLALARATKSKFFACIDKTESGNQEEMEMLTCTRPMTWLIKEELCVLAVAIL